MGFQILVASVGDSSDCGRLAAERVDSVAGSAGGIVIEIGRERSRQASLLALDAARKVEANLTGAFPELTAKTRGNLVYVSLAEDPSVPEVVERLREFAGELPIAVVSIEADYHRLLQLGWDQVLLHAGRRPTDHADQPGDPLTELVAEEADQHSDLVEIIEQSGRSVGLLSKLAARSGQATPLVLGGVFVMVLGAMALVAIAGAITGKARGQSVADLAAMSAAKSMKDDLPRLLAPPTLPNGLPNPAHLPKVSYLNRAKSAAVRVAGLSGAAPTAVLVRFPDRASYAPVRARISIATTVRAGPANSDHRAPPNWAEARVSFPISMGTVPAMASGGGYSGPLASRQGKGMRPDVAAAFDAMSAAAGAAGLTLVINSAFRSDAEQAALFAANPDPTWVAPPGQSLHRCATELDLGPPSSYGWLASNARRFGFVQRYSWEAWHYGFVVGPAPCSEEGNSVGLGTGGGDRSAALSQAVPSFTPEKYRPMILRAAMQWDVSAALLAAQLQAESGFNPGVVSHAGAQGIAQFMPGTAAMYGLSDPFDPAQAIMAQAHLMSDLLKQFGSPALALAAYNAGPGAVAPCKCIPPYAETQAYVAKIMAMLGGLGSMAPLGMRIELVR